MVAVRLDDIEFVGTEIPEKINFGGKQAQYVHKLVGGARVVDSMGKDDDQITFGGLLYGLFAMQRAKYLDTLRVEGKKILFTYLDLAWDVVVADCKIVVERENVINYSVTLTVVQDLNKPVSVVFPLSFLNQIDSTMNIVNSLGTLIADPSITTALASLNSVISGVPDLNSMTASQSASILGAANIANGAVTGAISALGGLL